MDIQGKKRIANYGDLYVDNVTGERAVVLRGEDDAGGPIVVHLVVRPGGEVTGAHVHPALRERFRVLDGRLGTRVAGVDHTLEAGEELTVPPGVEHDWWNAGDTEASVLVEIAPGDPRFVQMIATLFGLANAGKTNDQGEPGPLQGTLIGREFEDVIVFTSPPRLVQRVAHALLAPIARLRGLRGTYPEYLHPHGSVEPDPAALAAAGIESPATAAA
jgi:mannose-6-phosphate isomerase-like protein (cupin superfamily)